MLGFSEKRNLLCPVTFGHSSTGLTSMQEVLNNVSLGKTPEDKWVVTCQAVCLLVGVSTSAISFGES